jgi:hypothetical protein
MADLEIPYDITLGGDILADPVTSGSTSTRTSVAISRPKDNQYIEKYVNETDKLAGLVEKQGQAGATARSEMRDVISSPRPSYDANVTNQDMPKPALPSPIDPKEFQKFSGMALMVSALAGRRTSAPLTTALNAYSAGVNGYYKGKNDEWTKNMAIYQQQMAEWDKHHQELVNRYNSILNDRKMTLEEKRAGMELAAAELEHPILAEQIRQGGLLQAAKLTGDLEKMRYLVAKANASMTRGSGVDIDRLQKQMDAQLKPLNELNSKLKRVRTMVDDPSGASMPQIQAELAAIPDRSRLTNMFFDNMKGFGSLGQRTSNSISRFFQGNYSETNRQDIRQFIDFLENNYVKVQRQTIVDNYHRVADMRGLDKAQIFDRNAGPEPASDVPRRFAEDPAMKKYKLGNYSADGYEVLDSSGKVVGHYQ